MKPQITAYRDAHLLRLAESWALISRSDLVPPPGAILKGDSLLGFVYVCHERGFRLRIERDLVRDLNRPNGYIAHQLNHKWDLGYRELRRLSLRTLETKERKTLRLDLWPAELLLEHSNSELRHCRSIRSLDPLRHHGNPDVVRLWAKVGDDPCGKRIWARLEEEQFDGVFACTLLEEARDGYVAGMRIMALELEVEGKWGLFWLGEDDVVRRAATNRQLPQR
jgi:hypothetical protein